MLAILGTLSVIVAYYALPREKKCTITLSHLNTPLRQQINPSILLLATAYLMYGIAFTPHTLFIIAYFKQLHFGTQLCADAWMLFGTGTLFGTLGFGLLAARIGTYRCLQYNYILGFIMILLILLTHNIIVNLAATGIMGGLYLSIVALTAAQLSQIVPHSVFATLWGIMTLLFALAQSLSAYVMSGLVAKGEDPAIFIIALIALIIAIIANQVSPLQKTISCCISKA